MNHSDDCCHTSEAPPAHPDAEKSVSSEARGACGCNDHPQHGYLGHKEMHLRRLKRIEAWREWSMRKSTASTS